MVFASFFPLLIIVHLFLLICFQCFFFSNHIIKLIKFIKLKQINFLNPMFSCFFKYIGITLIFFYIVLFNLLFTELS